jgi:hypothetical protein
MIHGFGTPAIGRCSWVLQSDTTICFSGITEATLVVETCHLYR